MVCCRKSRLLNEIDGMIIGAFGFMSFSLYRAVHQSHHAHLATERDEELWPFVKPAVSRPARILAAILELTVGLLYTPFLFVRAFLRTGSTIRKKDLRRRIWVEFLLAAGLWIVIFAALHGGMCGSISSGCIWRPPGWPRTCKACANILNTSGSPDRR